jgi:ABC-2 type transport system ATP-binding protein
MLEIDDVSKTYGDRAALTGVSFSVGDGRLTGFVGANGSGKTTTMRIMLGVLTADSGRVRLDGRELGVEDRRRFGYMPEERGLYPKMRVAEQIVYLGRLHGMSRTAAQAATDRLLDRLDLDDRADTPVESLSLGNQQRAQIAAALVHEPEVLVLDEPFSGLDPIAVETVLGVLRETASTGVPVLFSSHQLDVVERLCDDVVVISGGVIRASGSRDALRRDHGGIRHEIVVDGDIGWLRDVPGVTVVDFAQGSALFESADDDVAQQVLRLALARGPVTRFAVQQPTLAQIFTEVVR